MQVSVRGGQVGTRAELPGRVIFGGRQERGDLIGGGGVALMGTDGRDANEWLNVHECSLCPGLIDLYSYFWRWEL